MMHPLLLELMLSRLIRAGKHVARDWISYPDIAKKEKSEQETAEYKLDGSVVIAEAIQAASYKLELIETLIVSAEKRRDTALVRLTQYRGELGIILRRASDRLIESKVVELPRRREGEDQRGAAGGVGGSGLSNSATPPTPRTLMTSTAPPARTLTASVTPTLRMVRGEHR